MSVGPWWSMLSWCLHIFLNNNNRYTHLNWLWINCPVKNDIFSGKSRKISSNLFPVKKIFFPVNLINMFQFTYCSKIQVFSGKRPLISSKSWLLYPTVFYNALINCLYSWQWHSQKFDLGVQLNIFGLKALLIWNFCK